MTKKRFQICSTTIARRLCPRPIAFKKNVTVLTLEKLCTILNCSVENVVRIVPEEKGEEA